MKTLACIVLGSLALAAPAAAQNLVITNAHIVDGKGGEIANGSVVIRDGRIVSVGEGTASAPGAQQIDAKGMTVVPAFIDAHRHLVIGEGQKWLSETAPG